MGKTNRDVVDFAAARNSAEGKTRFRKSSALLKGGVDNKTQNIETVWTPESLLSDYNVNDPQRFLDLQGKYAFGNNETGWALFERMDGFKAGSGDVVKFVGTVKGDKNHPLSWFEPRVDREPAVSLYSVQNFAVDHYNPKSEGVTADIQIQIHTYLRTILEPVMAQESAKKAEKLQASRRDALVAAAQAVSPKVETQPNIHEAKQEVSKDLSLLFKKKSGKFELPCGSVIGSWVHKKEGTFTHWVQVHSVTSASPLYNLKKVGFRRGWEGGISFRMQLVFSVPVLEQKEGITDDLYHDSVIIHGYLRSLGLEGGWILTPEQLAEKRAAKEKGVQYSTEPANVGDVEEVVLGAEAGVPQFTAESSTLVSQAA